MNKLKAVTVSFVFFSFFFPLTTWATLITIEPDDFNSLGNISFSTPGVTLTVQGTDSGFSPHVYVLDIINDPLYFDPFARAATGTKVFAALNTDIPFYFGGEWIEPQLIFRAAFQDPVNFVGLKFKNDTPNSAGFIRAYNAAGVLIAETLTPGVADTVINASVFTGSSQSIAYIEAGGRNSGNVSLDKLRFGVISGLPEPTSLALLGLGLVGLGVARMNIAA